MKSSVSIPLLATKLYIPPPRPDLVSRPRLVAQMDAGLQRKLTLISAPAGYGKTTLLSTWLSQLDLPVAWLALGQTDNEILRFFDYLIAALQVALPSFGKTIPKLQGTSVSVSIHALMTSLLNEILNLPENLLLVLDDYHVISEGEIHQLMMLLLENLPANLHLVIASRTDPPLQVARLRARAELIEIRARELRFTQMEAVEFLNGLLGLGLSTEDVQALSAKTEGWIAGLQLAAISLQEHQDREAFVRAFTGDDRYIADYLVDEALHHQLPHIQTFLLQTSILDRLSAPLCDAVTGRNDSHVILTALDRANIFITPLDNQRNWFSYHHLFAELLKKRLRQIKTVEVLDLHDKASAWYGENNLQADALNHALAANEINRIVDLTENMTVYKMDAGELNALIGWLDRQPQSILLQHPWLLVARTWALFNKGNYESVIASLVEIESILIRDSHLGELTARIRGHVAAIRSYLAELRDDPNDAIQQAEDSLALLPEKDSRLRSFVMIRLANCLVWLGDFDRALPLYSQAGAACKLIDDGHLAITALSEMAVVQMHIGNLRQAVEDIYDVTQYAVSLSQRDGRRLPAMGILYRHRSLIKRELNELSEAYHFVNEAIKICQQWGDIESLLFGLLALARVQYAMGEFEKLDQNLTQILQMAGQISPNAVEQFQSWVLYFQLLQGKTVDTEVWVQDLGLAVDDNFTFEDRFLYHNFARLLIAQGHYSWALKIVDTLLRVTADVGAKMYTIRYNLLKAVILENLNNPEDAMLAMGAALSMAEPEGYVRSFLDGGEPVARLLHQAARRGICKTYCLKLLDQFSTPAPPITDTSKRTEALVEPLSDREIEVLKWIARGLSNQEIAGELVLSLYTVKSHARNIYSKLGVKNRTEAVARARMLGLLPQG